MALVAVLLLLMMMTALAGALSVGSQTETFISRNENSGALAQAAAEAGLNHAVELAVTYIFQYKSNGFGSAAEAVNALLRGPDGASGNPDDDEDNMSFGARAGIDAAEDIPLGTNLDIAGASGVSYTAWILDDEDTAPPGNPDYAEDGDPTTDLNTRLLIRATGLGPDGSKVTLEATIGPVPLGAIVTEGDLTIDGSVHITGPDDEGAVHTNSDLTITGNGGVIEPVNGVTATGEVDNSNAGVAAVAGSPRVDIPEVSAADYEVWATHKLRSDGTMLNVSDGTVCTWSKKNSCNGWDWSSSTGTWSVTGGADPTDGTYYVEANVFMQANASSNITIIAEGDIVIQGSPDLTAHTTELLFVTDKDLKLDGTLATNLAVQGQMLVHEQADIGGNVTLGGQLIVEDAASNSSTVTSNSVHGNVTINYAGGLGSSTYSVVGWRDVRDAD